MKGKILIFFLAIILIASCTKESAEELNDQNALVGTTFLADPNGDAIDCSSFIPPRSAHGFPFRVYFNSSLTPEIIECLREEYFTSNPGLHLYIGPGSFPSPTDGEWWVFPNEGGPSTPKNGAGEDPVEDTRVCIRRPCQ